MAMSGGMIWQNTFLKQQSFEPHIVNIPCVKSWHKFQA